MDTMYDWVFGSNVFTIRNYRSDIGEWSFYPKRGSIGRKKRNKVTARISKLSRRINRGK